MARQGPVAWINARPGRVQWPELAKQSPVAWTKAGQWPVAWNKARKSLGRTTCRKEKGYEKEEEAAVVGLLTVGWSGQKKCVSCLLGRGCSCMLFELSDLQPFLAQVFCLGGLEESQMIDR